MIVLFIEGRPTPFQSPRVYKNCTFNPLTKKKIEIQNYIRTKYKGPLITNPVRVEYVFNFCIPKGFTKKQVQAILDGNDYYCKRPDISNICKFSDDFLIDTVIKDDSLIVECLTKKKYSSKNGTTIIIEELK